MADEYAQRSQDVSSQARGAYTVTPDDDNDLPTAAKALYVGSPGDLTVVPINAAVEDAVLFANHPIGYCPIQVSRVMETGTDADDIVALTD